MFPVRPNPAAPPALGERGARARVPEAQRSASYRSWMQQKFEVRFARDDPETPPTMDEQIALERKAAQKLGIPNCESKPLYRVGRNSHTGEAWAYVEWTWEGVQARGRGGVYRLNGI